MARYKPSKNLDIDGRKENGLQADKRTRRRKRRLLIAIMAIWLAGTTGAVVDTHLEMRQLRTAQQRIEQYETSRDEELEESIESLEDIVEAGFQTILDYIQTTSLTVVGQ